MNITIPSYDSLLPDRNKIKAINALYNAFKKLISGGISKENLAEDVQEAIDKAENAVSTPEGAGSPGQVLQLDSEGVPSWTTPSAGTVPDAELSESSTNAVQNKVITKELNDNYAKKEDLENGNIIPLYAETLEPWADQKAIATPDTYTDVVRTTGGDIPIETSAGSKIESIKPVAGSKWTAKLLFNGSYNMLNAAKWGAANSQPYVGGVGNDFVYFLVPELTLGTFGTADENNGLLFTDEDGVNVQPTSVYFKSLGTTVPQSLTDGTSITPINVSYDGKTYKDYATSGAGWLIIPKSYYDNDVCAHIAWEDWYGKHVSLNEPTTNPEAVVGILMLEELLALAHSDKYLRGVNEEVCDNIVFEETSATISHIVDEIEIAANSWTNNATGESDSQGNALYSHSATVSGIKQGGVACVEGEGGGIPLTVNGTTVSYIDTNATAPASVVFYQIPTTEVVEKAYTDNVFSGSNIDIETGVLPINDCSIEAQVAMDGSANITVKYAKNIVDQVAINATVDVPQIKHEVEEHEERITDLEDTAVRTGSYDASVAVGLADNFKGDTIVDAEFYKRKTGGTQSVGSGIAAVKEVRGKSIVWNQKVQYLSSANYNNNSTGSVSVVISDATLTFTSDGTYYSWASLKNIQTNNTIIHTHKYLLHYNVVETNLPLTSILVVSTAINKPHIAIRDMLSSVGVKNRIITFGENADGTIGGVGVSATSGVVLPEGSRCVIKDIMLFDLTLIYGAGNEPSTDTEFEKMFPLGYYDYNVGEVIPFAGQNLVTTGKNQYNPATGKANLLGGQTYQLLGTYTSATIDEVAVTLDSNNCFTTTKDCVLEITGGNDTDTIVALYNGENVAYEPYEKHTLPLDPSQWRDKQGNLVFPYGGMHGVDTAYDYAKVDSDGYIRKATPVYDEIDVGDYNYTKQGNLYTTDGFVPPKANMLFSRGKGVVWNQILPIPASNKSVTQNGVTITDNRDGSYTVQTIPEGSTASVTIWLNAVGIGENKKYVSKGSALPIFLGWGGNGKYATPSQKSNILTDTKTPFGIVVPSGTIIASPVTFSPIVIDLTLMFGAGNEPSTVEEFEAMFPLDYYNYDSGSLGLLSSATYTDAAAFKAAMQGVPLIYELATPVEVELATPIYAKYLVDKDGTEEITPTNGSTPYTTPANLSILYAMDARGTIANLPKNYLSKESAENMLNAMVTAGVITSYTMTWDAANNRYVFTIVAPTPEESNN